MRAAGIFGAIVLALFAFSALSGTPPGNSTPILWGVISDAGTVVLMDSGVQTSMIFPNPAGLDAILCVAQDAGASNPALAQITLLGSNDGKNMLVLGTSLVTPGVSGTVGWDPISSGVSFYALQVDGGGTVAGSISCSINNKGAQQ